MLPNKHLFCAEGTTIEGVPAAVDVPDLFMFDMQNGRGYLNSILGVGWQTIEQTKHFFANTSTRV